MKTVAYIDAFNLYYGALKGTPYKWLDPVKLCRLLLPGDEVVKVKYFTSRIRNFPHDEGASNRQLVYLRALRSLPEVEIVFGSFLKRRPWMPLGTYEFGIVGREDRSLNRKLEKALRHTGLLRMTEGRVPSLRIIRMDEKGSDVNLATHLVNDAHRDCFELAVVVSNDSDLYAPIETVRGDVGKPVGILNPHPMRNLKLAPMDLDGGSFYKKIRGGVLAESQLPEKVKVDGQKLTRPNAWKA